MNKGVKELIILAVIAVAIGIGACYINANTVAVQAATIDNSTGIKNIIGIKGNDLTGITSITDFNNQYTINYTYNANLNNSIIDEIGYALSDKIRQVYAKYPDTDKLNFVINLEFLNNGILVNKPYVQFDTTRAIFAKVDWNTYKYSQLLDIVANVKPISTEILVHDNLRLKETTIPIKKETTIPTKKEVIVPIKKDAMDAIPTPKMSEKKVMDAQKLGQD